MRMKDKRGIVAAAGSGMGRAGTVRFVREGAAVAGRGPARRSRRQRGIARERT